MITPETRARYRANQRLKLAADPYLRKRYLSHRAAYMRDLRSKRKALGLDNPNPYPRMRARYEAILKLI